MNTPLLEIKDLHAKVGDKEIIKGLNLTINKGEVHAIMGPNGAGKSTLSYVLTGKPEYEVTSGKINFNGKNLLAMSVEERAREGLFLIMQSPIEIPGVSVSSFLKYAVNAVRLHRGQSELDTMEFIKMLRSEATKFGISAEMLKRSVNVGFSGGEKKRLEALQLAMLQPCFAILDEADSGLDVDAIKVVSDGVNNIMNGERSLLVITHQQKLFKHIRPNFIHIFIDGHIVKSDDESLAEEIERDGYGAYTKEK